MFPTMLLHGALLAAALARADNVSLVTVAATTATVIVGNGLTNGTQQLAQLTTVGLSTVTVYSNQQKPPQATVTFTPGNSLGDLEVTLPPIDASQLSELTSSILANITSVVSNLTAPTASSNLTLSATSQDSATSSAATDTGSPEVSTATQSAPTTTNSTNQAADTNGLFGRSLKAMAVGFLLALAL
ncbi:hypothetical protein QC761_704485 [Podospora bellae-mahoneyi]|uniref:Cell wall protein n=1 Tax=Podospora bellae-mahoneyi TaxID=2093777 RepID=A0ABR0F4P1_9PEZI|nr:hypothetical protein QC761_704485 [Podospora bellae-mahoneyi]